MRLIRSSDYIVKPWKNGGGSLADIVLSPEGASLDQFDWRVSTAHVGSDGPFSIFPGIDRGMLILAGDGMQLDVEGHPLITLGLASPTFSFPGDAPAAAKLTDGPVDDLNVMTRRDRFTHTLIRRTLSGSETLTPRPSGVIVIYVEHGIVTASAGAQTLTATHRDTLILDRDMTTLTGVEATFCVADIRPI
jgi:environmental stress-induced protein Ves